MIMDYEKRYKEALERARELYSQHWVEWSDKDIENIFPELKESEDEKVRKEIIEYIKIGTYREDWIAWLEKQGEKKPDDKVGPRFKVGDWIVTDKNHIWFIDEDYSTTGYSYRLISQNGKVEVGDYNIVDEHARLWTIQDAKDGDVLVHNSIIFIFIGIENGIVKGICTELSDTILNFGEPEYDNDYCPATKEQRDLLFQKMHEAGYTFDFKKKEIKKLKFKVGDEIITENEESLIITRINEEGYWSNDLFICDFDSECIWDLVEQKSAEWKQENREELSDFENAMMHIGGSFFGKNAGLDPNDTAAIKEQAELLLELVPKPEWTEDDEKMLSNIVDCIKNLPIFYESININGEDKTTEQFICNTINWLKFLKQRIRG